MYYTHLSFLDPKLKHQICVSIKIVTVVSHVPRDKSACWMLVSRLLKHTEREENRFVILKRQ